MATRIVPPSSPATRQAWAPLGHAVFRSLWIAGLASDFGSFMHEVGEGWLMTTLTSSPLSVAVLASADSLAIFLLAVPAGALADVADRRRLAMVAQAWMLGTAALLGALTVTHRMTPGLLIGLTFVMGIGAAVDGPLWQAIVSEVVPRRDLPQAVTLGGLSYNLARAFAPALGGLVVAAAGPFAVFLLNAVTFLYTLVVLARWRGVKQRSTAPAERWLGAMQGGLRYVRHSPELVAAFVRAGASLFGGICLMALLPLFARRSLGLGSSGFGVLLGCMGAGAVAAAVLLPRLQGKLSAEATLSAGTLIFAAAVVALALAHAPWLAGAVMAVAGLAWMAMISSLNVAVQMATPSWVRARVLSVFLLVFQGALALGGVAWGALAARTDLRVALAAGGAAVAASVVARVWFPLSGRVPDFSPAAWPKPQLVCEPPEDAGPVLVTTSFRVPAPNLARFTRAAADLERMRRRSGAYGWRLFRDPSTPDELVEVYLVDSWAEHMRQHERLTAEEREAEKRLAALAVAGTEPVVHHLVAVDEDEREEDDGGAGKGR
jgi:MFS family permease